MQPCQPSRFSTAAQRILLMKWRALLNRLFTVFHYMEKASHAKKALDAIWTSRPMLEDSLKFIADVNAPKAYQKEVQECRHSDPGNVKEYTAGRHGKFRECAACGSRWFLVGTQFVRIDPRPAPGAKAPAVPTQLRERAVQRSSCSAASSEPVSAASNVGRAPKSKARARAAAVMPTTRPTPNFANLRMSAEEAAAQLSPDAQHFQMDAGDSASMSGVSAISRRSRPPSVQEFLSSTVESYELPEDELTLEELQEF